MNYHALDKREVLKELKSNDNGLSEKEVEERLKKYGKNEIDPTLKINKFKILIYQLKSIIIYVLFAAAIFSILINHYIDSSIIFAVIIINSTIGFIQQYKAEKSILQLRKIMVSVSKVFRNGKLQRINSNEIVPGDILYLQEGDKVAADCRILNTDELEVNEAILTGESMPVVKEDVILKESTMLAERKNMLYSGTSIITGNCKCLVVASGINTEFGKIAGMLEKLEQEETIMQRKLDKFAKQITFFSASISLVLLIIGLSYGLDKIELLLTAVVLAVSAIPEGLPAVITVGLALAASKMAKQNVIVRRLASAESLGSVTVICSDKTGTITEEKMRVKKIFANNTFFNKKSNSLADENGNINLIKEKEVYQLLKTSVLCNNARFELNSGKSERYEILGDSTESALITSALDLGVNKKNLTEKEKRVKEISFSSDRKMMSIIRDNGRAKTMYSKGASNVILDKCSFELVNGQIKKINQSRRDYLLKLSEKMEFEALRVLAFAYRAITKNSEEKGLIFLGFIGMQDSPRIEARKAIQSCMQAGIKVKMITGDSLITAREIANQVGIIGKIISGQELEKMSEKELLEEIDNIGVFARISPHQKLRIVEVLKLNGENVAITGDGVNDSLALKKADIGIAMGIKGTDVAREVSDMILVDDNFASIVNAVEEGRIVYENTKKITKYLLAVNFSEILLILTTILMSMPLPLLPVQILWMNLVTDSIPALALLKEKNPDVMKKKPQKEDSILSGIMRFIIIAGIITYLSELLVFLIGMNKNLPIEEVRSMVLTSNILFELFFIYTCRSEDSLKKIGIFSNKYVNFGILISIILHLVVTYTPLASIFGVAPLSFGDWIIVLPFALSGLFIFEMYKLVNKKY